MKTRMTALDVRAIVAQLRPLLIRLRLANIYDVNFSRRIYLFKFAKGDEKQHILIESGIRIHPTMYQRDKNMIPSSFAMKLRKHLRTRRLEGLNQLGADRVIDFVFGIGQNSTHLLIEFYVSGNIVLTDASYTILSVLRPHSNVDSGKVAVGQSYPIPSSEISFCLCPSLVSAAKHVLLCSSSGKTQSNSFEQMSGLFNEMESFLKHRLAELQQREEAKCQKAEEQQQHKKKKGGKKGETEPTIEKKGKLVTLSFRDALASMLPFAHSVLVSHALAKTQQTYEIPEITNSSKIDNNVVDLDDLESNRRQHFDFLCLASMECFKILISVSSPDDYLGVLNEIPSSLLRSSRNGWGTIDDIIQISTPKETESAIQSSDQSTIMEDSMLPKSQIEIYGDFSPVLLFSHESLAPEKLKQFDSFLQCVDTFFSNLELLKQSKQEKQAAEQGLTKSEKIKLDQQRRVNQLAEEQKKAEQFAKLIEANLSLVQRSISMLQAALSTGVGWSELWNHIKLEKRNNHPIACIIHSLDLEHQRANLLLQFKEYDSMEDDHAVMSVPVDLDISAYGNVERLHSGRKQMQHKLERTEIATKFALDKAKKKTDNKNMSQKLNQINCLTRIRKHFWFEKFNWFISSENYLVLAGRDAQQNDMLYKRYFDKNDIYVHADIHGAASCIIKNPSDEPVSPVTLLEAGRMSVCRSSAWDAKLITSAWWVYRAQVSKSAPTGEYLVSGGFIIRGKKNYLPPWKLEMGLGILFQMGEDSIGAHQGERRIRGAYHEEEISERKSFEEPQENLEGNKFRDSYGAVFPSEASRCTVELEIASENLRYDQEEALRQLKRLERRKVKEQDLKKGMGPKQEKKEITQQQSSGPIPRGKKRKLKRLKEKYGEQEPEEREIRMALLGAKHMKGVEHPSHEIQSKTIEATDGESGEEEEEVETEGMEIVDKKMKEEEVETEGMEMVDKKMKEEEGPIDDGINEVKVIENEDENLMQKKELKVEYSEDVEVMTTKLIELDCLTANPRSDDTLISAVPVCAPWSTLQSYKYKIKLLPGGMKKGKAGQQCLKLLAQQAMCPAECELIRTVDMSDLGNALVGNLKISMPGLQNLQKTEKAAKKQQKAAMRQNDE